MSRCPVCQKTMTATDCKMPKLLYGTELWLRNNVGVDAPSLICADCTGSVTFGPDRSAVPQVAPTEPQVALDELGAIIDAVRSRHAAPQPAPVPERCPTCGSRFRDERPCIKPEMCGFHVPNCEWCPDPWHRPAPLVEGEQG